MYDPFDSYWIADDKRVYGSKRQTIVTDTDPDYVAWVAIEGNYATIWPRDIAGAQTNESLQDVLTQYGLTVDLYAYAAKACGIRQAEGIVLNTTPLPSDRLTQSAVDAAYSYSQTNPAATYTARLPDNSFIVMDATQLAAYAMDLTHFYQACALCESDTCDAIDAGTITDRAQVDAAFDAVSNTFTTTELQIRKRQRRA